MGTRAHLDAMETGNSQKDLRSVNIFSLTSRYMYFHLPNHRMVFKNVSLHHNRKSQSIRREKIKLNQLGSINMPVDVKTEFFIFLVQHCLLSSPGTEYWNK
jgi:hypothetical protein